MSKKQHKTTMVTTKENSRIKQSLSFFCAVFAYAYRSASFIIFFELSHIDFHSENSFITVKQRNSHTHTNEFAILICLLNVIQTSSSFQGKKKQTFGEKEFHSKVLLCFFSPLYSD